MSKTSLPFSFQRCPLGLTRLVRGFHQRREESAEQARRRFFRRIFGILWVSVVKILSGVFSLQFLYKTDILSHSFFARFANKFNDFARILLPSPSTCQIMTSSYFNAPKFLKKVLSLCHLSFLMNKIMLTFISTNCCIDRLSLALKTQNPFA